MFSCELCFDNGILRIFTDTISQDVRQLGMCVMRVNVSFPRIEAEGEYTEAASRFSKFYAEVADNFLSYCVENIGKRASEEFTLADARKRYRFFRYECVCEFLPKLIESDNIRLLEIRRRVYLRRRSGTLWEDGDIFVWKLPSLLLAKDIKRS